jgi:hypothetical protein
MGLSFENDRNVVVSSLDETGINDGLVLYYTMDSLDGSTLLDNSGNNYHGTIYGATSTTGINGNALSFDGSNSRISNINSDGLGDISSTFSISVWTKGTIKSGDFSYIIHRGITYSISDSVYCIITNNTGYFCFPINGSYVVGATTVLQDSNSWYFLTLTFNNGAVKGFINGNLSVSYSNSITNTIVGTKLTIGDSTVTNSTRKYNGLIDEVRLYNRALSAAEVKQLYKLNAPNNVASMKEE